MDDLVAELQDFRHLRWDERTTTSGTSGTFPKAQLHALDGEAGALEAVDDLADVPVAHAVGLDHGVGLLDSHGNPFV